MHHTIKHFKQSKTTTTSLWKIIIAYRSRNTQLYSPKQAERKTFYSLFCGLQTIFQKLISKGRGLLLKRPYFSLPLKLTCRSKELSTWSVDLILIGRKAHMRKYFFFKKYCQSQSTKDLNFKLSALN